MSGDYGRDASEDREQGPAAAIEDLVDDVRNDVEDLSEDFGDLDAQWPVSVAFVDEGVTKEDWWDEEPLDDADNVQSDVAVFRERVLDALDDLDDAVEAVSQVDERDAEWAEPHLSSSLAAVASLEAATDDFDRQLSVASRVFSFAQRAKQAAQAAYNKVKNWIKKKLKPIIRQVSNQLWKLIKQIKTLDSWTIGGDLGVSALGFQGSANMSLTFKP